MTVRIKTTFHPRGEFVLCRVVPVLKRKGLFMPETSQEGKQYIVEAVGDKVTDLSKGAKVLVMGQFKVDWDFLPGHGDLFIVPQRLVVLSYTEEEVEDEG